MVGCIACRFRPCGLNPRCWIIGASGSWFGANADSVAGGAGGREVWGFCCGFWRADVAELGVLRLDVSGAGV